MDDAVREEGRGEGGEEEGRLRLRVAEECVRREEQRRVPRDGGAIGERM